MKVYLERKDIPDFCTECPFQINDTCMLQGDGTCLDFDTWDEMYAGCPLKAVEDYGSEKQRSEIFDVLKKEIQKFYEELF